MFYTVIYDHYISMYINSYQTDKHMGKFEQVPRYESVASQY